MSRGHKVFVNGSKGILHGITEIKRIRFFVSDVRGQPVGAKLRRLVTPVSIKDTQPREWHFESPVLALLSSKSDFDTGFKGRLRPQRDGRDFDLDGAHVLNGISVLVKEKNVRKRSIGHRRPCAKRTQQKKTHLSSM
jgi:hypothetical protein